MSQFRVLGKGGKCRTVYCTVGALATVTDGLVGAIETIADAPM